MSLGDRLREERERLGLKQPQMAEMMGSTKQTVYAWENGRTAPDGFQLDAFAAAGADVLYIVTGERQGQGLGESAVHQAVLDAVDLLSLAKKVDADQLARAVVKLCARHAVHAPTPSSQIQHVSGNKGKVSQSGQIITVKMEKKK